MTIARDKATGAVIGQATDAPVNRTFIGAEYVRLLTRGGRYVTVPRSSVRLEVLR